MWSLWSDAEPGVRWHHGGSAFVDSVDDLGVIDAAQVHRRHAQIGMPQLALNDGDRDPFARHLDRVSVPELMWSEPATNTSTHGRRAQLLPCGGRRPRPTCGPTVQYAQ